MGKFWVPDALMEVALSPTAKLLYVMLCRSTSGRDPWDYTHRQLGDAIGVKERSIRLALVELNAAGMVTWKRSSKGFRLNFYAVHPPERWSPKAFKRHVVPVEGHRNRQERADQPAPNAERNRHQVPTPGSKTYLEDLQPGSTTTTLAADAAEQVLPSGFMEFWKRYPKHEGKSKALTAWRKLRPLPDLQREIMAGLELWRGSRSWADGYVPRAERWLREKGWDDDPEPDRPRLAFGNEAVFRRFLDRGEAEETDRPRLNPELEGVAKRFIQRRERERHGG